MLHVRRRLVAERLVDSLVATEMKIGRQRLFGFPNRPVVLQVDLFVFHGPPQAFDEHVARRVVRRFRYMASMPICPMSR